MKSRTILSSIAVNRLRGIVFECVQRSGKGGSSELSAPRRTTRSRCERLMLVCMRDAPSYGTRWRRRTSKWISCSATIRCEGGQCFCKATQTRESQGGTYIPCDGDAFDGEEGQGGARLPVLRGLRDEVVDGVAQKNVLAEEGVRLCSHNATTPSTSLQVVLPRRHWLPDRVCVRVSVCVRRGFDQGSWRTKW